MKNLIRVIKKVIVGNKFVESAGDGEIPNNMKSSLHPAFPVGDEQKPSPIGNKISMLSKKMAFTLAELLITITIVGVVAAMVLPTINKRIQNTANKVALKNAYSILYQAMQMYKADTNNNMVDTYCGGQHNVKDRYTFVNEISKYFKGKTTYAKGTGNLKTIGYKNSYFKTFTGKIYFNGDGHGKGAIVLNNGMIVFSSNCWADPNYFDFIVDVNGTKEPNRLGYDVFYFQIDRLNNVYPTAGSQIKSTREYNWNNKYCCNNSSDSTCLNFNVNGTLLGDNGVSCTYYALSDKNQNDSSKGYWNSLK